MIEPVNVPVSMKSATKCPSIVQAFVKGPLMPVDENPMPFMLIRITEVAVDWSAVFMMKISFGSPSAFRPMTTWPPVPPVRRFVAFSMAMSM